MRTRSMDACVGIILSFTLLIHRSTAAAPPINIPGGDWPTYRHDPGMTAISPLKGGLVQAPVVAWSIDLGGPRIASETVLLRDVTGDGPEEIVIVGQDSLECRRATGQRLWILEGYAHPAVVDIRDYAGDGSRGILVTTTVGGRVEAFMIEGRTGRSQLLWKDENNFGGHTRFGKLLAGVRGAQVASTSSGQTPPAPQGGHIRLVSFEDGLDRPHFRINQSLPGDFYSPLMLFDDLDGDGAVEMAVVSHEALWSFDTANGRQELYARYAPMIRTYYASIASIKLAAADTTPALVMINPHIPGLKAVRQDGKSGASTLWKVVIGGKEDQYQSSIQIKPGGPDVVSDLDGDGRHEVLASITNELGDGTQHLVIFDATTGRRLAELGDLRVFAVDDLNGDGRPEVLLQDGPNRRISRWDGKGFDQIRGGDRVEPVLQPLPAEGDLRRTSGGNPTVRRAPASPNLFLLRFAEGIRACRLEGSQLVRVKAIDDRAIAEPSRTGNETLALRTSLEGGAVITRKGSAEVYRYEPPALQTYLAPPPLVADLNGSRRILVRDSTGTLLIVPPDGGPARTRITGTSEQFQTHVDPAGSGPTVCDMDGDGENEVVTTLVDGGGKPYCAILDGRGKLERRLDLEPGMAFLDRGPTGRLGPGLGRWIVLRMASSSTGAFAGGSPLVVAFDGKTGAKLWTRDHYASYGPNPVKFAAHFPTAVHDLDGDGADDWLVCSENFYGVISPRNNRDLVGPMILSDTLPGHWTAYSYPSIGPIRADGELGLLHSNSYAMALITDLRGNPLWHQGLTRDTAGTWNILADLNGDGAREFVHAQPDGRIRCFDASVRRPRCATCPPGADRGKDEPHDPARWTIDLGRPTSRMVAADLDGDGRHEVLFGGSDGHLYALGEAAGKARLLWKVHLGRRVGEPILADLDADGRAEILVPTEAGHLVCLRGTPSAVR